MQNCIASVVAAESGDGISDDERGGCAGAANRSAARRKLKTPSKRSPRLRLVLAHILILFNIFLIKILQYYNEETKVRKYYVICRYPNNK